MSLKSKSSSLIDAMQYIAEKEELFVSLKNGKKYAYYKVTPQIAKDFKDAESLGKYFNAYIRGNFEYNEIFI